MIKFLRYFYNQWCTYPSFKWFYEEHLGLDKFEEIIQGDKDPEKSRRMLNNRFCFAWETAKEYYGHRDRYGRKCRMAGGDCEICTAKHC